MTLAFTRDELDATLVLKYATHVTMRRVLQRLGRDGLFQKIGRVKMLDEVIIEHFMGRVELSQREMRLLRLHHNHLHAQGYFAEGFEMRRYRGLFMSERKDKLGGTIIRDKNDDGMGVRCADDGSVHPICDGYPARMSNFVTVGEVVSCETEDGTKAMRVVFNAHEDAVRGKSLAMEGLITRRKADSVIVESVLTAIALVPKGTGLDPDCDHLEVLNDNGEWEPVAW